MKWRYIVPGKWDEIPTSFLLKVLFFYYYIVIDIYQHCLKGFTFNFFFLFFLWIKAIAGFFPQTKLLFPFYPIRIIGFIFIFMTVFSTAILNQYWIWTLWPTICLTDQLNENIYLIGCTEQLFYIISTGNYFQGVSLELCLCSNIHH